MSLAHCGKRWLGPPVWAGLLHLSSQGLPAISHQRGCIVRFKTLNPSPVHFGRHNHNTDNRYFE